MRLTLALFLTTAFLHAQPQGLPPVPFPPQNQYSLAKANLGKTLFWDEQLSATGTVACATCHTPEAGGADLRTRTSINPGADNVFGTPDDVHGSPGVISNNADGTYVRDVRFKLRPQVTRRKAPSVLMAAYSPLQFWDGRADTVYTDPITNQVVIPGGGSLETQAKAPPVNTDEMAHIGADWSSVASRIRSARPLALASNVPAALDAWLQNRAYPQLFQEAFGTPDVTPQRINFAIATYERTLVPNQAPIDAFLAGNQNALTPQEQQGFNVFNGPGRCNQCHGNALFTNNQFRNIGVRPIAEDRGRAEVTNAPIDEGSFKVPSLRNVAQRSPFFHSGRFNTLREVVDFYERGGDFHVNQSPQIQPFQINQGEHAALEAFLTNALTDPRAAQGLPPFDHPTLYSLTGRVPQGYGAGAPGSGAFVPRMVVVDPPVLGNPRFTLGLADTLGQAPAILLLDIAPDTVNARPWGIPLQVGMTPLLSVIDFGTVAGAGAGGGYVSRVLAIPGATALVGLSLYGQAFVGDSGTPVGLAASSGVKFTLFAPR